MSLSCLPFPSIVYIIPQDLPDLLHIDATSTTTHDTHIFSIKAQEFKPKDLHLPLKFGTTECLDTSSIDPFLLSITKSKGGKVQVEDMSLIQSPPFSPMSPI
jgi:hypothetical protein